MYSVPSDCLAVSRGDTGAGGPCSAVEVPELEVCAVDQWRRGESTDRPTDGASQLHRRDAKDLQTSTAGQLLAETDKYPASPRPGSCGM